MTPQQLTASRVGLVMSGVVGTVWPVWHWGIRDATTLGVFGEHPNASTPWPFLGGSLAELLGVIALLIAAKQGASRLSELRRRRM